MHVLREEIPGKGEVVVRLEHFISFDAGFLLFCFLVFFRQRRIEGARSQIARQTATNAHSSFPGLRFAPKCLA